MSFRRVNRSKKVPGVKLRPAAPDESKSNKQKERVLARASRSNNDDMEMEDSQDTTVDSCPRPFRGVVLCATGVQNKTDLFGKAFELGALSINDFTDTVTHLIAEAPGSAKYQCAVQRRIPIMHPSWITENYETWLRGDDVTFEETVAPHRLPIFNGVIVCVSGIDDIARRTTINRKVTAEGGEYSKNLERPVRVTHLLCASITEEITEKMKYAQKFNKAGEANIELVWEEWFWDCLTLGGRVDEEPYRITNAPRPPIILPQEPSSSEPAVASTSQTQATTPPSSASVSHSSSNPAQIPNDGEDDEEIARVKRVPAVTLQIWENLLKPRGFEVTEGKLTRSPSKSQTRAAGKDVRRPSRERSISPTREKVQRMSSTRGTKEQGKEGAPRPSMLSSFRRATSFAPASQKSASGPSQLFKRTDTLIDLPGSFLAARAGSSVRDEPAVPDNLQDRGQESVGPSNLSVSRLFAGMRFRVRGDANCEAVHSALSEHGGAWHEEEGDSPSVDYIIVRLVSASEFYRQEESEAERAKYRTECWLERCIYDERICLPEEHITFTPLKIEAPIACAENVILTYSGLEQAEACWVRRLLRVLGITLASNFSRRSTHLLCPSGEGPKAEKAREWDIPVVDMTWLTEIATNGVIPPAPGSVRVGPPSRSSSKGKEREVDMVDSIAIDIMDGRPSGSQSGPAVGPDRAQEQREVHPLEHNEDQQTAPHDEDDTFGLPSLLLENPQEDGRIEATPPPSTRAQSPVPLEASRHSTLPPSIERDKASMRIPSSASPSPMKILPVEGDAGAPDPQSDSESPVRISRQATKSLQETVTTLLGKRPSEEEAGAAGPTGAPVRGGRSAKRTRPPSKNKTAADPEVLQTVPRHGKNLYYLAQMAADDLSSMSVQADGDGDVLIMYEDPVQRAEKKRLMNLLESEQRSMPWDAEPESLPQSKPVTTSRNSRATRRDGRIPR